MKKVSLLAFLCLLFCGLAFTVSAQSSAQDPTDNSQIVGWKMACLDTIRCTEDGANCKEKEFHRALLSPGKDPIDSNLTAYVVECFSLVEGSENDAIKVCTTGSSELDKKAFCPLSNPTTNPGCNQYDFYSQLKRDYGYSLDVSEDEGKNGIYRHDTGQRIGAIPHPGAKIPTLEWQSYIEDNHMHKFLAVQPFTETVNFEQESNSGNQQALIEFEKTGEKCVPLMWDPAGHVFDSKTLEPVPNSSVFLAKKYGDVFKDALQSEQGIVNPLITQSNGEFNFIVSDGIYKLTPTTSNYTFPLKDAATMHSNYSKVYSNIYPVQTGDEIIQKGKLEYRDIPLVPATSTGYRFNLRLLDLFHELNKIKGVVSVTARVSHPFAVAKVYSLKADPNNPTKLIRSQLLATKQADKRGFFNIDIDGNKLAKDEMIGEIDFIKTDLTSDFMQSNAPTVGNPVTIRLEPIPNFVEGIAYDNNGSPLPNSDIGIYTDFSGIPYYRTKTDANGKFRVSSEYLPNVPFKLKYNDKLARTAVTGVPTPTGVAKPEQTVNTSKFLSQNTDYIKANNINTNSYLNREGKPLVVNNQDEFREGGVRPSLAVESKDGQRMSTAIMMLIFVMVLVVIAITLGMYLFKRNPPPTNTPPVQ